MRMGLYRRHYLNPRQRRKAGCFFIIMILVLSLFVTGLLLSRIHSVFEIRAVAFANGVATQAVNDATHDYMAEHNISYDSFVMLKTDDTNTPTALEADTGMMNSFRADITEKIAQHVESNVNGTIFIPIGSLLGNDLFNGMGYNIPVKVAPTNIVDVDFEDEFTSVGINQMKHSMYLKAKISISIMTSAMHTNETVEVKFPIADTVIMGKVPNYYGTGMTAVLPEQNTQ